LAESRGVERAREGCGVMSAASAMPPPEFRRRYPGTGPFGPEDATLFFGRRRETEELYLRILSVPLMLQFGRSGLGKTSLLQAGLFPLLRARPFLPVMIRLNDARESLTDAVARSIRESALNEGVDIDDTTPAGLWELLATTTAWRDDLLLTPVLVFDQFEEVFTLRDQAFRDGLAAELGALATGIPPERLGGAQLAREAPVERPEVKLLISLKETHLGALEQFSARIPGLFQERLRLEPLSESEARDAVVKPAKLEGTKGQPPYWTKPFTYDENALDDMMAYLKGRSDVIEPFQLQLLCQHAEGIARRMQSTQSEPVKLTKNDFKGSNAFAVVLANFYRDVLSRIPSPPERRRARALCEDGLLGSSGQRLMLEKKQILSDFGVSESTLEVLGRERLVREERRMESTFYELSHDRLADSVFAARSEKLPKSVRRALWASGVAALLILALLIVGVLAVWNRTVQKERDSAENLLGFLLGEQFLGEVRDVGRSTLLLQVQEQVDRRGVGMRSALNRGLSLRNRGEIRRTEGSLAEAVALFRESLKAFESAGDHADALREIARTEDRLGNALANQGKPTEGLPYIEAADTHWRIVANTPGPADVVRTDCTSMAESLVVTVELKTRMGDSGGALTDLERTFTILSELMFGRGQTPAQCGPLAEQAAPYPDPTALQALTRAALARAVLFLSREDYEGAAALAGQARLLRPSSISARKTALFTLAWRGQARLSASPEAALADYRRVLAESEELRRSDPDDRQWQRERGASQLLVSTGIVACNEKPGSCTPSPTLDDAEALVLEATAALRALASVDTTNTSLQDDLVWAGQARSAILEARGGHAAERLSVIRNAQHIRDQAVRDPNDAGGEQTAVHLLREEADILLELGRLPEARETLRRALDRATKLVAAHPDNALYFQTLGVTWARQAVLLGKDGDPKGAAAASAEEKRATARFGFLSLDQAAASTALRDRGIAHVTRGAKLMSTEPADYAAARRELVAAETVFREAVHRRPASYGTYDELRNMYDRLQQTEHGLGRKEERFESLSASMHAAQIAAWLAPESAQSAMNNRLLDARNVFAQALIAENDRKSSEAALGLMQEAVVVADSLVEREPDNPDYRFSLADAKCGLGLVRRNLGVAGWENAVRSGLIDVQRAATLAPDRVLFRTKQASWRRYLGEQLAKNEGEKERAGAELALALQGYEDAARLDPKSSEAQEGIREVRALIGAGRR
jgi:tetratricopeptide (TPR) repeat protein